MERAWASQRAGLPLLLAPSLPVVLAGLTLIGIGTFFAQATATGFVSRAATTDRGSASGIYLASYFFGGLVGSAVLGQFFDRWGWVGVRGRHRRRARRSGAPRGPAEDPDGDCLIIAALYRNGRKTAFPSGRSTPHDQCVRFTII